MKIELVILDQRLSDGTFQPQTVGSAGIDLIACVDAPIILEAGAKSVLIPLGFKMHIADRNVAGIIIPRSGLGHKQGLVCGNGLGLIDSDYQGQWFMSAWARPNGEMNKIIINPGDRIGQMIFVPVLHPEFEIVDQLSDGTTRGAGGFGSTN